MLPGKVKKDKGLAEIPPIPPRFQSHGETGGPYDADRDFLFTLTSQYGEFRV
jgi:hypothetical protein